MAGSCYMSYTAAHPWGSAHWAHDCISHIALQPFHSVSIRYNVTLIITGPKYSAYLKVIITGDQKFNIPLKDIL